MSDSFYKPLTSGELSKLDNPETKEELIKKAINQLSNKETDTLDLNKDPLEQQNTPVEGQTGVFYKNKNCPHCGWDLNKSSEIEPTEEDKLAFLQATLGLTRFYKEYSFFDGQIKVVFRTLTNEEWDLCYTQAMYDVENDQEKSEFRKAYRLPDYQLSLSLSVFTSQKGKVTLPEIDKMVCSAPPGKNTKLYFLVPYVYDKVIIQEPLRKLCYNTFSKFVELTHKLMTRIEDPNFWQAIKLQG